MRGRRAATTSRQFLAVCAKWNVPATVIGEVTDGEHLEIRWHGEPIVDVRAETVAHAGPGLRAAVLAARPRRTPCRPTPADRLPRPTTGAELRATLLRLVASPEPLLARLGHRPVRPLRARRHRARAARGRRHGPHRRGAPGRGIALALDGNGRYARLDPYAGAQLALAEACRNVAASGARPLAVTNCLNFGSPEDPGVMWQFAEAVRGLADACRELGLPVTGGNVSFYNSTGDAPILPTPVVGVLGVIDDVTRRTPVGFRTAGDAVYLLGETRDEFGGSEWAHVVHAHLGGTPPAGRPGRRAPAGRGAARPVASGGLLDAAHDLSDGGLAQALGRGLPARRQRRTRRAARRTTRSSRCSASRPAAAVVAVEPEPTEPS